MMPAIVCREVKTTRLIVAPLWSGNRVNAAMPRAKQFESLSVSELHCPKCRMARPVRERLLLVLPGGEVHEYRCAVCGESLGTRRTTQPLTPRAPRR